MYIGEASKKSGATVKAIRHYQDIGLLVNILRKGNYRVFSDDDVLTIQFIQMAQEVGFKLTELKPLLNHSEVCSKWLNIQELIQQKKTVLSQQIKQLQSSQKQLIAYEKEIIDCLSNNKNCKFP